MKKIYIIIFAIIFVFNSSFSQKPLDGISLGFTAIPAINVAKFDNAISLPGSIELTPRVTFQGGFVIKKKLNQQFDLETGIRITSIGLRRRLTTQHSMSQGSEYRNIYTSSFTTGYVPVLLRFNFSAQQKYNTFIKMGLWFMPEKKKTGTVGSKTKHTDAYDNTVYEETFVQNTMTSSYSLMAGVGVSKNLQDGRQLNLSIFCNQSLDAVASWSYELIVNSTDRYTSRIVNKFFFLGIELSFLFRESGIRE